MFDDGKSTQMIQNHFESFLDKQNELDILKAQQTKPVNGFKFAIGALKSLGLSIDARFAF
jgi:hypothetical protein